MKSVPKHTPKFTKFLFVQQCLESAVYASRLITEACFNEKIKQQQLVLHSDNGAPMKGIVAQIGI